MSPKKIGIVLFNLGGPLENADVKPFLSNLFSDPAIINLPSFLRLPLEYFIASRREKSAQANYQLMGGGSPILAQTEAQAKALQSRLEALLPDCHFRVSIAMRHWHPLTEAAVADMEELEADDIVLLPLYPQFSTTTTGSSLKRFKTLYEGLAKVRAVCCYPTDQAFIQSHVKLIQEEVEKRNISTGYRILFSAHGLPKSVIKKGDPYQSQIEASVAAIMKGLEGSTASKFAHTISYQSRVGPLEWIGPSTPEAIGLAGQVGESILLVPISFVSEHIETLVELDREYAHMAAISGVRDYVRVPTIGLSEAYIDSLSQSVIRALTQPSEITSRYVCAHGFKTCPKLLLQSQTS